jgi:hypothetical protein
VLTTNAASVATAYPPAADTTTAPPRASNADPKRSPTAALTRKSTPTVCTRWK